MFAIRIHHVRHALNVLRGSVNVKTRRGGKKREAYLVFLVTGGDVLLDPFGLQSLVWRAFLILIYAAVAKTSLRNHNVSLVAASPTRHPGPLLCSDVQKPTENHPALAQKTRFVHISWAAADSGTPLRRYLRQRRRVRLRSSASVSASHRAAKMTEAGNHMRLV